MNTISTKIHLSTPQVVTPHTLYRINNQAAVELLTQFAANLEQQWLKQLRRSISQIQHLLTPSKLCARLGPLQTIAM